MVPCLKQFNEAGGKPSTRFPPEGLVEHIQPPKKNKHGNTRNCLVNFNKEFLLNLRSTFSYIKLIEAMFISQYFIHYSKYRFLKANAVIWYETMCSYIILYASHI